MLFRVRPTKGSPGNWPSGNGWWQAADGHWYPLAERPPVPARGPRESRIYRHDAGAAGGRPGRAVGFLAIILAALVALAVVLLFAPDVQPALGPGPARRPLRVLPRADLSRRVRHYAHRGGGGGPATRVSRVAMNVVATNALTYEVRPGLHRREGPFPFILDTGASGSVVDAALAAVLRLPAAG